MSKQIKPMDGEPAESLLLGIQADVCRPDSSEWKRREWTDEGERPGFGAIEGVVHRIGFYVDPNVCLNWRQAIAFRRDIARICRNSSNLESTELQPHKALHVYKIQDLEELQRVALLVNSSRHACENCLAENCYRRDPAVPLEEVAKREMRDYGNVVALLYELNLPDLVLNRIGRVLHREGLSVVRNLLQCSEADLLKIRGFGPRSLMYIKRGLVQHGLELKKVEESS